MIQKTPLIQYVREEQQQELFESLHYLNMGELKKLCALYALPITNKKEQLISFIYAYVTGQPIIVPQPIPAQSKAQKGAKLPLAADVLMLKGAYKNDAKTRAFFKELVGSHFHFTAYGIDWLNERWMQGKPPTYKEFALFWQQEHERRKNEPALPKREWALLNFIQRYGKSHPAATRQEVMKAWHSERRKRVDRVGEILPIDAY